MGRPDAECRCPACRAPLPAGTQPLQLNPTLKCLAELLLPGGSDLGRGGQKEMLS